MITGRLVLRLLAVDTIRAVDAVIKRAAQDVQRREIVQSANVSIVAQSINNQATQVRKHNELYNVVWELLQRLEGFEKVIDSLSKIHPFFSIAWSLTSILYKATLKIFQADNDVIQLDRTMGKAFLFVRDVQTLRDKAVTLQRPIEGLIKQTIECCIFVLEY